MNINVEEILRKKCGSYRFDNMELEDIKAAIKEIAEAIVEKCKNEVKMKDVRLLNGAGDGYETVKRIDFSSILNVKTMIDYE